jgi:hypothetical protein
MRQREFEITIRKDGSVEVQVKGYKGRRCLDAVRMFERVIGKQKSQRLTSEYYDPEEEVQYRIDQRH